MSTQIFVNLPVRDLPASKAFFNALGYATNPSFTNDEAACLVISDSIYVMLLVEPFFQGFTRKSLCDARTHTEVLLCLSTLASGLMPSFELTLLARFIAGLPHGAYLGVASLLAASLMGPGSQGKGAAVALSGLTVANLVGICKDYFGWELKERDVEAGVLDRGHLVQAWCTIRDANGNRVALTNTVADALRGKKNLDILFS